MGALAAAPWAPVSPQRAQVARMGSHAAVLRELRSAVIHGCHMVLHRAAVNHDGRVKTLGSFRVRLEQRL